MWIHSCSGGASSPKAFALRCCSLWSVAPHIRLSMCSPICKLLGPYCKWNVSCWARLYQRRLRTLDVQIQTFKLRWHRLDWKSLLTSLDPNLCHSELLWSLSTPAELPTREPVAAEAALASIRNFDVHSGFFLHTSGWSMVEPSIELFQKTMNGPQNYLEMNLQKHA